MSPFFLDEQYPILLIMNKATIQKKKIHRLTHLNKQKNIKSSALLYNYREQWSLEIE